MNAPYYLLIGGTWVRINGVQRGVSRKSDRPSSQTVSLDGVRRRQRDQLRDDFVMTGS